MLWRGEYGFFSNVWSSFFSETCVTSSLSARVGFFLFDFLSSYLFFFSSSYLRFLIFSYFFFCKLFFISDIFDSRKLSLSCSFRYSELALSNPISFFPSYSPPIFFIFVSWLVLPLFTLTSALYLRKYLWLFNLSSS